MTTALRTCTVCQATFTNLTDYSVHATLDHGIRRGTSTVPRRPVSCWRCAAEINVNKTTRCACGFDLASQPTLRDRLPNLNTEQDTKS